MKIDTLTKPAKEYNEDGLLTYKNVYMVLDGATPLFNNRSQQEESIATKYVKLMIDKFKTYYDQKDDFESAMNKANQDAINMFYNSKLSKAELPSAGLAAAVDKGQYLDLYVTGDCEIRVQRQTYVDNHMDTRLRKIDDQALNDIYNHSYNEKDIKEILINNRNKLATKDGYDALMPLKGYSLNLKKRKVKKDSVCALLLYTDGFFSATRNTFNILRVNELFKYDLEEIYQKILDKAKSDPQLNKFKRFKIIDDITAIKITYKDTCKGKTL